MCIEGTKGHEVYLNFDDFFILIIKTQHSSFSSNEFKIFLQENHICKLVLYGFLAEYCINQTAIDTLQEGYEVVLIKRAYRNRGRCPVKKTRNAIEFRK